MPNKTDIFLIIIYEICICCLIYIIFDMTYPNPIDVYRGNTRLEITYEIVDNDTVSIDSIVKWKN